MAGSLLGVRSRNTIACLPKLPATSEKTVGGGRSPRDTLTIRDAVRIVSSCLLFSFKLEVLVRSRASVCAHACVGVYVSMRMRVTARSARARAFVRGGGGQFPPVYQCFLFLFLEEGEEE